MKIISSINEMTFFVKDAKSKAKSIGLVPTMGYLHQGHLSLIKEARVLTDTVVVSIFVNPTQFEPDEDYASYPRDMKRDALEAEKAGADVIFAPSAEQMYPESYSTYVKVEGLGEVLCGRNRPGHFRGVTTVCAKLFSIVKPDIAFFGQKDAQQSVIIQKMVKDLNMDIKLKVLPTVREDDGLAMSSRNKYLSSKQRKDALVLHKALDQAKSVIEAGENDAAKIEERMRSIINKVDSKIDYISIVDPGSLKDVSIISGRVLIALAVWIGRARLIDNIIIHR